MLGMAGCGSLGGCQGRWDGGAWQCLSWPLLTLDVFIRVFLPICWEQSWREGWSGKGQHFPVLVWVQCQGRHQPTSAGARGTGCWWLCPPWLVTSVLMAVQALAECPQDFCGIQAVKKT